MNSYFETLSQTIDWAFQEVVLRGALVKNPEEAREQMGAEHIPYRSFDFELESLKGRKTRKWLHVVITRLDSGHYELVTYVL